MSTNYPSTSKRKKREPSPKLKKLIENAAAPADASEPLDFLRLAGISSSLEFEAALSVSWLDSIFLLENRAKKPSSTLVCGTIRAAIDATRSKNPVSSQVDDTLPGQRVELFTNHKFSPQDHDDARIAIRNVIEKFACCSNFVRDARDAGKSTNQIEKLLEAAIKSSIRSPKTIVTYAKHVLTFYDYLIENNVPDREWVGPFSIFHLFAFFERRAGTTVPATTRCAMRTFGEALRLDWNLDARELANICSKPEKEPKQAPMLKLESIKYFEKTAVDKSRPFADRLYAANFALMCHASLRYDDTRTVSNIETDENRLTGRITAPKVHSIEASKFICPLEGFVNSQWTNPIMTFRDAYQKKMSFAPSFLFPTTTGKGKTILETAAKKTAVLTTFRKMIEESGERDPSAYTLHSPRNWYTSVAAQLGWCTKAQTTLGRWGDDSNMPNKYNRQKGTVELSVRSDIIDRIKKGWLPADGEAQILAPPAAGSKHTLRNDTAYLDR